MRKIVYMLASLFIGCGIPIAFGGDKDGRYSIRGAGLLSCKTFVEERAKKSPAYMMIGGWLDGYITAFNKLKKDTYDITPYATTELLSVVINRHCASNPDDLLAPVLDSMLIRLYEDRLDKASPFIVIRVGNYQTRLYARTVHEIQTILSRKGLFKEDATGKWGNSTQTSLASYQQSIGFEATGFPDQKTLWHLLRSGK